MNGVFDCASMKKLSNLLRFLATQAVFAALLYGQYVGYVPASRLLFFWIWLFFVLSLFLHSTIKKPEKLKDAVKESRERGWIPRRLSVLLNFIGVCLLASQGHYATAVALLLGFASASVYIDTINKAMAQEDLANTSLSDRA